MGKPYSNRALRAGTILREWRLEEVLGVGGFGIVYKGRGIYFNELVAIKEYFPGSISERDEEDTVVPIDSDAEEVHALGLKKFVEEAKLLWNLSTPTRHPNIVNVRSLFEIHGTAYMVMDFEDGVSLSSLLKEKTRFNERTLRNLIRPIAIGLDGAHRVGVLHRDIKPPNILINPDGRPVLIDFGSARFESADATSTAVTFHTPPYAAIEQYVKTYPQGPWTDIYALGVVLYECVTGTKPPEVLERLHGNKSAPLADGHWPGFTPKFLAAIDAAMKIPPKDRPQSVSEWLALFEEEGDAAAHQVTVKLPDAGEDVTRFATFDKTQEEILPVVAPPEGAPPKLETGVPSDPEEVRFTRAGEEHAEVPAAGPAAVPVVAAAATAAAGSGAAKDETPAPAPTAAPAKKPAANSNEVGKSRRTALVAGGVLAALVVGGGAIWATRDPAPQAAALVTTDEPSLSEARPGFSEPSVLGPVEPTNAIVDNGLMPQENAAAPVAVAKKADEPTPEPKKAKVAAKAVTAPKLAAAAAAPKTAAADVTEADTAGVSSGKISELNSVIADGRDMARQVIRMGRNRRGESGSDAERKNYQTRVDNARLATGYDQYLSTVRGSVGTITSDRDADRVLGKVKQTRAYLVFLVKSSTGAK